MNVREIEIFRMVMLEGSISGAARKLNVAQPAVSKYVARLEARIGLSLFVRVGNKIVPTPEARALYEQVDRVFVSLDKIDRFIGDLSASRIGHITVACMPMLSLSVLPDALVTFMSVRPDVSVSLQTRSSARIVEWVAARQVDFGVGLGVSTHDEVLFEPAADLELFCALPPGDPLESLTEIGPDDLNGRDVITLSNHDRTQLAIDFLLSQKLISPRRRIEVFWTSVALELAMRGAGIAFTDRISAARVPGGLECLRRFRPKLTMKIGFFWPRHWEPTLLARALAAEVKTAIASHASCAAKPGVLSCVDGSFGSRL